MITSVMTVMAVFLYCTRNGIGEMDQALQPIYFNNPNLIVDLGVGLWAWPLPMDFDRDGDNDLLVSCPDTPYNGLYFFENTSDGREKMPIFKPAIKIGPGDKNLRCCFVDGVPRVLGPGVEYVDFRRSILSDPQLLFAKDSLEKAHSRIRFSQWKYADYENDGDLDLIVGIDEWGNYGWENAYDDAGNWTRGPLHGYVYLLENRTGRYLNRGKLTAGGEPIDVYGAPSPNLEDFDGDGDLDLICGEFLDRLTWFENIGSRDNPEFDQGRFLENEDGLIRMDVEMIIPTAIDWDKDGDIDLVVGDEDGRVALIENSGTVLNRMPVFKSPVYFQQQADLVKFGALVTPFSIDWDHDGDEDLICGNTAGYLGFIENLDGGDPPKWQRPVLLRAEGQTIRIMAGENGSIQGPAERKWGYTTLSVADWDHDGLEDIMVNSIWGKVEWYKNIGSRNAPALAPAQPVQVDRGSEIPKPEWNWWQPQERQLVTQWRTTPCAIDWNRDGLTDLIMLDPEGYLTWFERFEQEGAFLLKPGQRIFYGSNASVFDSKNNIMDATAGLLRLNNQRAGKSGRRKICFSDWDQDGDLDLLVNSENVAWFENKGSKNGNVLLTYRGNLSQIKLAGHTTSPTTVDWNRDGIPDLLIGAEDGHFYYFRNPGGNNLSIAY
ncbi:VCBS repeat-containing protein [candidate division KSB1 bacterium]|nr:VCBS repeat-containing protein [candidate division KSB1 bacterium]